MDGLALHEVFLAGHYTVAVWPVAYLLSRGMPLSTGEDHFIVPLRINGRNKTEDLRAAGMCDPMGLYPGDISLQEAGFPGCFRSEVSGETGDS